MYRSFSNRIFAGVCGGLASSTPLNAWIWRLIFILLALLTMGVGAILYVLMWWLLPMDSPLRSREGGSLPGLIAVLLSVLLLGLWFGRNALNLTGAYWGIAFLALALVFLLKQIITRRGQNISIGLVAVAIPTVFLLRHYAVLQEGAIDILVRSAPSVLVFLGLSIALRYRVRFGSWIALILSAALVAGLVTYAYSTRIDVVSSDNEIAVLIPNEAEHNQAVIGDSITTLGLSVITIDTDVTITVNEVSRVIEAHFVGSNNSRLEIAYNEDDPTLASVQISERRRSEFPLLEDIGRGELIVEIPADIAVILTFNSGRANSVTLDMGELDLERLSFTVEEGDVLVRLPLYQPLSPSVVDSNGTWRVNGGNLRVIVPQELGVRFSLTRANNAEPGNFDELSYQLLLEGADYVLASRQYDNLDARMQYRVNVAGGSFSLEIAE